MFTKISKVAAAWRSIALAVGLKEVVPTLEVENPHFELSIIRVKELVAMLMTMVCWLLIWSIVKMSCPIQMITFDHLNECDGSHSDWNDRQKLIVNNLMQVSRRTRRTDRHRLKELLEIWRERRRPTYNVQSLIAILDSQVRFWRRSFCVVADLVMVGCMWMAMFLRKAMGQSKI